MGTVFPRQSDNMKLIAVLALAAVAFAEPEADPKADPWYTYGGYTGYPYAGVYGGYRTYGAYPYAYGNRFVYGKRSAEAEPEAEADPALLYTSSVAGGLVSPVVSSLYTHPVASVAAPLTTYTHAVAAPVVKSVVAAPAVAKTVVSSPVTYTVPHVAYPGVIYGKRSAEAEANPALVYSGVAHPLTYTHHVAAPAVAAYTVPVTTVHKAPAHGVAATYAGLVHSSHVGVCLNNVGVQVPC